MKNYEDSQHAQEAVGIETGSPGKKKKRYRKPAFRYERVFETRALHCGKMADTQQSCKHNHKNS